MNCCCYCLTIRQGSYLAAIWSLAYTGLQLRDVYSDVAVHQTNHTELHRESVINPHGWNAQELSIMYSLLLSTYTLVMISLPFMIVGIKKVNPNLLVPWLLATGLATLSDMAISFYILIFKGVRFEPVTSFVFTSEFFIFMVQLYSILCVGSLYKYSKTGREGISAVMDYESANSYPLNIIRKKSMAQDAQELSKILEEEEERELCENTVSGKKDSSSDNGGNSDDHLSSNPTTSGTGTGTSSASSPAPKPCKPSEV